MNTDRQTDRPKLGNNRCHKISNKYRNWEQNLQHKHHTRNTIYQIPSSVQHSTDTV